jgi:lambda repressor-like predicted transcriptional regulator
MSKVHSLTPVITRLRSRGWSLRIISLVCGCSVGTVLRALSTHEEADGHR